MRTAALLATLLITAPQAATDQKSTVPEGTVIASAQVTGFDITHLSPGLRDTIRGLAGTPLKQERLDEIVARLEAERPRWVAASRAVMDSDGKARVSFLMGRRDQPDQEENVNGRYIIDEAEITGVSDDRLSQELRDELHALVGKRLDSGDADRVEDRIERELPKYEISRQIRRGNERGHIRLLYELRKKEPPSWLQFEPQRWNLLFHSEQGWGGYLDAGIGTRNIRVTPIVAIDNADDLPEEYSGFGLRFETRRLGTRRLGAGLEWSWFDSDWRGATLNTLALNPNGPRPYDSRSTIRPWLKFAITPDFSVTGGVNISELDPLVSFEPVATASQAANALIGSIEYRRGWTQSGVDHQVQGSFGARAGTRQLESDLVYQRYLGEGSYRFDFGRHHVQAAAMGGAINGQAPLFERFTLGDSTTLRGWDKYDIAPAGGNRVAYSSVEYRYTGVGLFLDVGSVWNTGTQKRTRVSTGFGLRWGTAFLVVGFPLNTNNVTAVVTMGVRVPGAGFRW